MTPLPDMQRLGFEVSEKPSKSFERIQLTSTCENSGRSNRIDQ